jgi:uncharacterized protein (TIGR04255 family)
MDTRSITIVSSVFEARYEPKVSVGDKMGMFHDQYKDFRLAEFDPVRISISNHNNTKTKFLSLENAGITNVPCVDKDSFLKECNDITQFLSGKADIKQLTRIGIRLEMVIPIKDSEMGNETMNFLLKLFGKNAVKQLGQSVGDFQLQIGSHDEDINYRLNFLFAKREDDNNSKITKDLPKQGLIIDADCSRENISIEEAEAFINASINFVTSKIRNFLGNFLIRSEK